MKPLVSYCGFVAEHDELLFVNTNEMNKPAIIQFAYLCNKIDSLMSFTIELIEIEQQNSSEICEFGYLRLP